MCIHFFLITHIASSIHCTCSCIANPIKPSSKNNRGGSSVIGEKWRLSVCLNPHPDAVLPEAGWSVLGSRAARPSLPWPPYLCNNVRRARRASPLLSTPPTCPTPAQIQAPLGRPPAITQLLRRLSFRGDGCRAGVECLHEASWHSRASASTNGRAEGAVETVGCQFSSGSFSPLHYCFFSLFSQPGPLGFFLFTPACFITVQEALGRAAGENTWLCNAI